MGLMKLSTKPDAALERCTYIEIFRGTSLVVQLYWIFFVLPLFGISIEKFIAGYLAVGMNIGAYGAELVRGGILSVPKGQHLCLWSRAYWHPLSIFRDEGIRHDCQFSNDRSDCDFERLSVFPEPVVERGEVSV